MLGSPAGPAVLFKTGGILRNNRSCLLVVNTASNKWLKTLCLDSVSSYCTAFLGNTGHTSFCRRLRLASKIHIAAHRLSCVLQVECRAGMKCVRMRQAGRSSASAGYEKRRTPTQVKQYDHSTQTSRFARRRHSATCTGPTSPTACGPHPFWTFHCMCCRLADLGTMVVESDRLE